MKKGARFQAVIDVIDEFIKTKKPVDNILNHYVRSKKYIGSHDRREIYDLVYDFFRSYGVILNLIENIGFEKINSRQKVILYCLIIKKMSLEEIEDIFQQTYPKPLLITGFERKMLSHAQEKQADIQPDSVSHFYPKWLEPYLEKAFPKKFDQEIKALNKQARVDLRVNSLLASKDDVLKEMSKTISEISEMPFSPMGFFWKKRLPIGNISLFQKGAFEVQGEAAQIASYLTDVKPGMRVLDCCAGAGGKTLSMAAMMENKGTIVACDVSQKRLSRMKERLKRANVHNVRTRVILDKEDPWIKKQKANFDRVVLDVPCSGTGTWARNADSKWRFAQSDLMELIEKQQAILKSVRHLVKPGGHLVYMTCSVLQEENEEQIKSFMANDNEYSVVPISEIWDQYIKKPMIENTEYLFLSPFKTQTDGFFVAVLKRKKL